MRHADLINQLRRQNPHEADEVCNLMGAAARALEDDAVLHKGIARLLDWCEAYIGRAQAEGLYDQCVVSGEKCLEFISTIRKDL